MSRGPGRPRKFTGGDIALVVENAMTIQGYETAIFQPVIIYDYRYDYPGIHQKGQYLTQRITGAPYYTSYGVTSWRNSHDIHPIHTYYPLFGARRSESNYRDWRRNVEFVYDGQTTTDAPRP